MSNLNLTCIFRVLKTVWTCITYTSFDPFILYYTIHLAQAVTRKLDGEPAEESGSAAKRPCDTPAMPTETPSPSPTSSLTSHFVGITRTGWDTLEKSSLTRRKQKIAGKLVDAVKEVNSKLKKTRID